MRRISWALVAAAVVMAGFAGQVGATPQVGATLGTATVTVTGNSGNVTYALAVTLAGQFAAGDHTFSGTLTGKGQYDRTAPTWLPVPSITFNVTGASAGRRLGAACQATYVERENSIVAMQVGGDTDSLRPAGVLDVSCLYSFDGATSIPGSFTVVLLPTTAGTYKGLFAGAPVVTGNPGVPVVSIGASSVGTRTSSTGTAIDVALNGQLTVGGRTFTGVAQGSAPFVAPPRVPAFTLTGMSPTGRLTATCSGTFAGSGDMGALAGTGGAGTSVLTCTGRVNGGPSGAVRLLATYPLVTSGSARGLSWSDYQGVFVGL